MKPGTYRLSKDVFIFKEGDYMVLLDESYATAICDSCGMKKKCDWLEYKGPEWKTGMDCCRSCQLKILVNVKKNYCADCGKALSDNERNDKMEDDDL